MSMSLNAAQNRGRRAAALSATALTLTLAMALPALAQDIVVGDGDTFTVPVDPTVIDSLNIEAGGTVELGTFNLIVNDEIDTTFSGTTHGVINDSQLIKNGSGTLTLDNYLQDGGEFIVSGGTVRLDAGTTEIRYLAVGSGSGGSAVMTMTGGTLEIGALVTSPAPSLQVGDWDGSGTFNQSGGLVHIQTDSGLNVGNQGGTGIYNLSGGELRLEGGLTGIGRSTSDARTSDGTVNVSDTGFLNIISGNFVIGNRDDTAPNSGTKGKVVQTGGTIRVASGIGFFIAGFDTTATVDGQYDLLGGTLEIGGDSLRPRYNNGTSTYLFNFGAGTIEVTGSLLDTDVDATLVDGTLATIDTNGLGANFGGVLSGAGGLRKIGDAVLLLENGGNSFSGGIQLEGGILRAGAAGALPDHNAIVIDGGTLDLNDFAMEAGALSGLGGTLDLGTVTFTLDQAADSSFAGVILGDGGLIKNGAGLLELSGASSYAGPTQVNDGTLVVNGSLASVVTLSGDARLGGDGTLGGLVLGSGTTLAPGNSIGTVSTVDASFVAGALYEVEVDGAGNSDRLDASGTVTIDGGTVRVLTALGTQTSAPYLIIDSDNAIVRNADFLVETDSLFLEASLDYATDPTAVLLNLVRNATTFASLAASPNQQAVGEALDAAGPGDPVADAVATTGSAAQAQAAFDALSGEIHASAATLLLDDSRFLREALSRRLEGDPALPKRPLLGTPAVTWMEAFGAFGTWEGDGTAAAVDREGGGLFVGLDQALDRNLRLGLVGGYQHSEIEVDERASTLEVDSFLVGLYGQARFGGLGLQLGGALAWHQVDSSRAVAVGPLDESLTADYDAYTAQVFAEAGYRFELGGFGLEPFAGLAYVQVGSESFTEQGGAAALTADDADSDALVSTLGLRGEASVAVTPTQALTLRGLVGWRHRLTDETPETDMAFQGGADFTVQGLPLAHDSVVLQAGVGLEVARGVAIGVSYSGLIGEDVSDQGVNATLRISF